METQRESLFEWVTRVLRDPDPPAELGRLGAPARRALEENLAPGETARVVIRGTAGQAIVGTDIRVLVLPVFTPGDDPGPEVSSWTYLDVLCVEVNEGIYGGSVVLRVAEGEVAIAAAGDWDVIRARVATLRGLIAGAHSDSLPAELRLVAL
jgi:hypothetical protein